MRDIDALTMSPMRLYCEGVSVEPVSPVQVSASEGEARRAATAPPGEKQLADEAALLAESFRYGQQSEINHAVLQQHQARVAELFHRQAFRKETGYTHLTPVRTTVETPVPPDITTPTPVVPQPPVVAQTPIAVRLYGKRVVPEPEPEPVDDDPGTAQLRRETEQLAIIRRQAFDGSYRTPDERKVLQDAEDDLSSRMYWRKQTGQNYIPDAICQRRQPRK